MARVSARCVLTFGLVSVDIDSAFEDQSIHMHWLHKKCGSRVQISWFVRCGGTRRFSARAEANNALANNDGQKLRAAL